MSAASKCWITSRVLLQAGRPRARNPFKASSEKTAPALKLRPSEMAELLEHRQIKHKLTNRDPDTRATQRRLENSERKILDRKVRIGRDFDEGLERDWHYPKPSHK